MGKKKKKRRRTTKSRREEKKVREADRDTKSLREEAIEH